MKVEEGFLRITKSSQFAIRCTPQLVWAHPCEVSFICCSAAPAPFSPLYSVTLISFSRLFSNILRRHADIGRFPAFSWASYMPLTNIVMVLKTNLHVAKRSCNWHGKESTKQTAPGRTIIKYQCMPSFTGTTSSSNVQNNPNG